MFGTVPHELLFEMGEYLTTNSDAYCIFTTKKHLSKLLQPLLNQATTKIENAAKERKLPLIHYAVYEDSCSIAKLALKLEPHRINESFSISGTPLCIASWKSYPKMVSFLLENGANPNTKDPLDIYAETPLNQALSNIIHSERLTSPKEYKNYQVMELLLAAGANPNIPDKRGLNALLQAASKGNPELIDAILKTGLIDINTQSRNGSTALHFAVAESGDGSAAVVEALLKQRIDTNLKNVHGRTALFKSSTVENTALLIKYGADTNPTDLSGQTIFHHLAGHMSHSFAFKMMKEIILTTLPVAVDQLDNNGWSAMDYARYVQNEAMVLLLEKYQADCWNTRSEFRKLSLF